MGLTNAFINMDPVLAQGSGQLGTYRIGQVPAERIVFAVEGPDAERERAREPRSQPRPEGRDR